MPRQRLFKVWAPMSAAVVAVALTPSLGHAQNVTFADFTQQDPTQRLFVKTGNLFSATDVPVFFRFSVDNAYGAKNVFISARLTFSEAFVGPVSSGAGNNAVQMLQNINAVFTADTAGLNGSTNLLNMTTSTGQFNAGGQAGGQNSATDGGNVVNFSSAALSFVNTSSRNASFSYTSITPSIDSASAVQNQNIPDFSTSGGGQFASNPAPVSAVAAPEPATLPLMALSLVGSVVFVARRRKAGAKPRAQEVSLKAV